LTSDPVVVPDDYFTHSRHLIPDGGEEESAPVEQVYPDSSVDFHGFATGVVNDGHIYDNPVFSSS